MPPADTAEKEEDEGDEDGVPAEEEEEAETPLACFTKETDVGIEQYLSSSHKGFFAILKQRYVSGGRGRRSSGTWPASHTPTGRGCWVGVCTFGCLQTHTAPHQS